MSKSCRLVSFNKEMGEPGKPISNDRRQDDEPEIQINDGKSNTDIHKSSADEMPCPCAFFAVLRKVKGPELIIILKVSHNFNSFLFPEGKETQITRSQSALLHGFLLPVW
jgi:hypothetical protein